MSKASCATAAIPVGVCTMSEDGCGRPSPTSPPPLTEGYMVASSVALDVPGPAGIPATGPADRIDYHFAEPTSPPPRS